jgi:hypothetical protein
MHASSGVARSLFLRLHQNPDLVIERIVLNSKKRRYSSSIGRTDFPSTPNVLVIYQPSEVVKNTASRDVVSPAMTHSDQNAYDVKDCMVEGTKFQGCAIAHVKYAP